MIAVFMMGTALTLKAQDKLFKTNGEVLETKIMEIGSTEVKYKVFANLNGPVYNIPKSLVLKIVYENGQTENFDPKSTTADVPVKRAQNIFIEAAAQGLILTANYDTRFGQKRDGIGGRVGIGAIGSGYGDNLFSVPVSLNYLLGSGKNFFELGLGATYIKLSTDDPDGFFGDGGNKVIGTMAFMYRLQPEKSGFSFRGGFTPIFFDGSLQYWGGLSLGYAF